MKQPVVAKARTKKSITLLDIPEEASLSEAQVYTVEKIIDLFRADYLDNVDVGTALNSRLVRLLVDHKNRIKFKDLLQKINNDELRSYICHRCALLGRELQEVVRVSGFVDRYNE